MKRIFSIVLVTFFLSLCFYGEVGAIPVTLSSETYMANAITTAWDTTTTPSWTLFNEDLDNPPNSSSPPLSAHAAIPTIMNGSDYDAIANALAQSGNLSMSATAESDNADYHVTAYAHAGFVGDFTATTPKIFFAYDMSYDLSASGDHAYAGFSYSWSLWDITDPGGSLIGGNSGFFDITSGSQSDITSDEIMLVTTLGHQYRFYFDSGPMLNAGVTGVGEAIAFLTAEYSLDTESARVPEPSTLFLLGSGLAGLGFIRRKLQINS